MDGSRLTTVWRRVLSLAWPVMAEQTSRTLMRTTDVLLAATFSPAAVVGLGLADLYARFPLRIGLGLGGGAIALASQDTGAGGGAAANRDEAVTQALLLGALAGVPLAAAGVLFGRPLIALLGADAAAVALGGSYLSVILLTAPARIVSLVGARSLQGTGDTVTPMRVNVAANALNVAGSVVLGLGFFGVPRYGILGVGVATAAANVFSALALLAAVGAPGTEAGFARPRNPVIAEQLVAVGAPRVAEGLTATLAEFPLNALLLSFGTAVNAGFQVGRRLYQQVTGPLSRGYGVAASVVVGQALGGAAREGGGEGERNPQGAASGEEGAGGADGLRDARYAGGAVAALALPTVGAVGLLLAAAAGPLVGLFSGDPAVVRYATAFARVYGAAAPALAVFVALSGALQGAGETRAPFLARLTGTVGFLLGLSYLLGVVLGHGPAGAYVGLFCSYVWMGGVVAAVFRRGDWAARAADMMAERGSATE